MSGIICALSFLSFPCFHSPRDTLMKIKSLIAALSFVGLASAATAAPLTYNVSRLIGLGSVAGTVTTDGTFGVLATANVTSWSLTLNDGVSMLAITEANSQFVAFGTGLTADGDSIDFDFAATDVGFGFQSPALFNPDNIWCGNGVGSVQCFGSLSVEQVRTNNPGTPTVGRVGVVELASRTVTVTANAVPEPASLALVGLALVGVAVARRRV